MEPKDFIAKWHITREELATLTSKSMPTVNRWFGSDTYRDPGDEIRSLLATIDAAWTMRETLDNLPSHFWAVHTLSRARREVAGDQ